MPRPDVDVIVFDVLGTLVDEPTGLRAALSAAVPAADARQVEQLLARWTTHVDEAQQQIVAGQRPFAASDVINREAAELVLGGDGGSVAVDDLVRASWNLPAWPDSARGIARLAARWPVVALSNASPPDLLRLGTHAGLRWHHALSAASAHAYKPDPRVYGLALELARVPADRLLMVAAHAWDLRGARAVGLRTAYVARPVGDPPAAGEHFDFHADGLDDLAGQLGVPVPDPE